MLTFALLMTTAAGLEVTFGKTRQCFVCGQGDFFDFGADNDACAKIIKPEHLRPCEGIEDVCKTTVTRQIYFSTNSIGETVNTTVETFDRACATPSEQRDDFISGEVYKKTESVDEGLIETEEVYCDKAGCNFHLAEEYPLVKEKIQPRAPLPNPILNSAAATTTTQLVAALFMVILMV